MYLHRFEGYLYTDALTYNEFYFVKEKPHIQGFQSFSEDSLLIKLMPETNENSWRIQDTNGTYFYKGHQPVLKLRQGKQRYHIYLKNSTINIDMQVEYKPEDNYTYVSMCSIPIIENTLYPIDHWTKLPSNVSQPEIDEVKKILRQEVLISDSSSSLEKTSKIGAYLIKKLHPHEGDPTGNMKSLTPYQQFVSACQNKNKIDCADYADIYFMFANCAGVPTRRIGIAGWVDYITTSGHVVNESYIIEKQKWAFVDLTSKKILTFVNENTPLNTIDVLHANREQTLQGIKTLFVNKTGGIDTVLYEKVNQSEREYFKPNSIFYAIYPDINNNMGFKECFEEYLSTHSHYGQYYNGTFKVDNSKHYLKRFVFKISIFVFLVWVLFIAFHLFLWGIKYRRNHSIKAHT
ncbi:MAG: hypothetical protein JST67_06135 [Bacteroidetes bacterium]|nr:hypothetical protein [Bacteroidota bacterium]